MKRKEKKRKFEKVGIIQEKGSVSLVPEMVGDIVGQNGKNKGKRGN